MRFVHLSGCRGQASRSNISYFLICRLPVFPSFLLQALTDWLTCEINIRVIELHALFILPQDNKCNFNFTKISFKFLTKYVTFCLHKEKNVGCYLSRQMVFCNDVSLFETEKWLRILLKSVLSNEIQKLRNRQIQIWNVQMTLKYADFRVNLWISSTISFRTVIKYGLSNERQTKKLTVHVVLFLIGRFVKSLKMVSEW